MQVIKLNGEHLTFKGRVYGSVGIEYRIEYDETAFHKEYNCEYAYSKEDRDNVRRRRRFYCDIRTYSIKERTV